MSLVQRQATLREMHAGRQRYTRLLEDKVAELEAQSLDAGQNGSFARQTSPQSSLARGERPEHHPHSVPTPNTPGIIPPSFQLNEGLSGVENRTAERFAVPTCADSNIPFSSPLDATMSNTSLDIDDRCGHSSLFVNILAALTTGNPCGIPITSDEPLRDVRISTAAPSGLLKRTFCLSDDIGDALIDIYLQRVNPRYPFLHVDTFIGWYKSWKNIRFKDPTADQKDRWMDFFVVMVQAVSILLTPQVSQSSICTSQTLYNMAMKFLPFIFIKSDPILSVQAYLLLTLHALHSPSSHMIVSMVSATMRHCAINQLHLAENEPKVPFPSFSLEVQIRRRVFWSAYALDRLISWIYHIPNNLIDEHITVEMFSNVEDTHLYLDTTEMDQDVAASLPQRTRISPALHLIRCRCIQSRIVSTMMRSDFSKINSSPAWREHMLEELEAWRTQLQRLSHRTSRGYLSDRWVGMAYNYTILLLHQPTKQNVCGMFGDRSVRASVQIMLTFREFQKDRQTAQLWPGLLSQFNVGLTFLYCFWATPVQYRTSAYKTREASEALRACSISLAILAERWVQAEPLRDVFEILAKEIPLKETIHDDSFPRPMAPESVAQINSQIDWIRSVVKNRGVLRMLEEMITEEFPSSHVEQTERRTIESTLAHDTGEHLCPEHCSLFPGTVFHNPITSAGDIPGEYNAAFDDTLIFPALFGSVEF
ncbi:hypothetical protein N7532_005544 [Penicillium argentinense]|uniref:Xylanolytic transcriptional activator regulatory domain-containing protein n=1 Tax=Penicillium argentinense TaxID=1131581 RepID=A0A9W9FE34_9EURO|nr:uncharacterized protein N7532_005544 [Penicillium argentinense]KAJ5098543.1 hypothetical protein N7532_005544 [Penicillium argentinense]